MPDNIRAARIAVANLSALIDSLELRRRRRCRPFEDLMRCRRSLFLRGDLFGRIVDHDRAESVANEAIALSSDAATRALHPARGFRGPFPSVRGSEARFSIERSRPDIHRREIDIERAALLQATGRYEDALVLREKSAKVNPGIQTLGALASLLAEMGRWVAAENSYAAALDADNGVSPLPCSQAAVRMGRERDAPRRSGSGRGDLRPNSMRSCRRMSRDEDIAPKWRSRADSWTSLRRSVTPLLEISDDPEYRADVRRDPGRAWRQQSCQRSGTCFCSV